MFQMLQSNFEEQDMRQLPSNVNELRANPVTAWTPKLEQILCRSLSFSEYEMISHPAMVLTVVSSSDKDVIASMQELSPLSTLSCLQNVSIRVSVLPLGVKSRFYRVNTSPMSTGFTFCCMTPVITRELM